MAVLEPVYWQTVTPTIESLVLFENADHDIQPPMLVEVAWAEVRQFFIEQVQALGQRWFGLADAADTE